MATSSFNKIKGLTTFFNHLSTSPEGSQSVASNVVIDRDNIIEPRRGMKVLCDIPSQAKQLLNYKDRVLTHYDSNIGYLSNTDPAVLTTYQGSSNVHIESAGTIITLVNHGFVQGDSLVLIKTRDFSDVNNISYLPYPAGVNEYTDYVVFNVINTDQFEISTPGGMSAIALGTGYTTLSYNYVLQEVEPGLRVKSIELNGSLYVTAKDGVKKISAISPFAIGDAGGIQALNIDLALDFSSSAGFFGPITDGAQQVEVSYRVVWGTKDINNVLILGAPSERATIINTTGMNATVDVSFPVPNGINTSYFYQIYRTNVFGIGGSGDEMKLVIEAPYDGYSTIITVNDATPETIRNSGTPLYINENSGEGVFQTNNRPPVCQDITVYKDRAWFANTKTSQKFDLTFLGFDGISPHYDVSAVTGDAFTTTLDIGTHNIQVGDYIAVVTPDDVLDGDGQKEVTGITGTTITFDGDSTDYSTDTHVYTSHIKITKNTQINRYFPVGQPEIATLVHETIPLTNFDVGAYFTLTTIDDRIKYYFWIAKTESDIDPLPTFTEPRIGVRVNLYDVDETNTEIPFSTTEEITERIIDVLNNTGGFFATSTTPAEITILTATSGMVTDSEANLINGDGFISLTKDQDGYGENAALGFYRLSSYVSPAAAIEDTTKSLVNVINFTPSSPVYAYYLTTDISLPGQFFLEEKEFSENSFQVVANDASFGKMFSPELSPLSPGYSTNNVGANVLMFSKVQQPEAVPIVNSFKIGPQDKAIKRILALRDSLFILKEEGIYRLTGENEANFNIALSDNSATIIAPDSAVVLNNQAHCLTTQGVSTITDAGVGVISRNIENIFNRVSSEDFVNSSTAIFGVSYEADRSYLIFIPKEPNDITAKMALRYNSFTQTWTSIEKSAVCGIVNIKNKLYLGCDDINSIEIERKRLNSRDYADRQYTRQLSIYQNGRVYLDNVIAMEQGDTLTQTQYLTINDYNQFIQRLKQDPVLNFSQTFPLLTMNGGADFVNAMIDLKNELNLKDTTRVLLNIDLSTDVDLGTDTFNIVNHGLENNDVIFIQNTSGTLPTPLLNNEYYRVVNVTGNTFQLTNLYANILTQGPALGIGTFTSLTTQLSFNMVRDIDYSTSRIIFNEHGLVEGEEITFSTSDTPPNGLINGRMYKAVDVTTESFRVQEIVIDMTGSPSGTTEFQEVYFYDGASDSKQMQKEFNDMVTSVNNSLGAFIANYTLSEGSEDLDLYIKEVFFSQNYVTLELSGPFFIGEIEHYKSIKSEAIWNTFNLGDPAMLKHVRSGSVMVESNSIDKLEVGYASDLSGNFENVTFRMNGNGAFGKSVFGNTAFGGTGTEYSARTLIPRQKQRCRIIAPRIFHYSAFYKFAILGVSFDYEVTSDRSSRS